MWYKDYARFKCRQHDSVEGAMYKDKSFTAAKVSFQQLQSYRNFPWSRYFDNNGEYPLYASSKSCLKSELDFMQHAFSEAGIGNRSHVKSLSPTQIQLQ